MGIIPTLRSGERTINHDQDKAHALLETFIPPLRNIQHQSPRDRLLSNPLPMEMLIEHEIEVASMRMASWKALDQTHCQWSCGNRCGLP